MNKIIVTFLFLLTVPLVFAQSLDNLSPEQLELYKKYKSQGLTNTSQENVSKEVNRNTTDILKSKKEGLKKDNFQTLEDSLLIERVLKEKKTKKTGELLDPDELKVFGADLFNSKDLTFEPKLNIPTPHNYILGTNDEVLIDISGLYEANYKLRVSPEGQIKIPAAGMLKVGGMPIEAATSIIRNKLALIYTGVSTGQTRVNVALGDIRSIRVSIVGEAFKPGTYTLPSLATAYNALYACGGPGKMGSMRDIKIIRNGKVVANLDLYKFLLDGDLSKSIVLQEEDVIRIEPYQKRVIINGAIKHPAIFEALSGETLSDLIRFAGGFTENASSRIITGFRIEDKIKKVADIEKQNYDSYTLESGDEFRVAIQFQEFTNKVEISGAVFRPGSYELEEGLTVKKLIQKADGIKENAYKNMAVLIRKKDQDLPFTIGFNLGEVISGIASDIPLLKNDSISICEIDSFQIPVTVSIWGAVKYPGKYELKENTTLRALIFKARGFTEFASTESVELIRMIKDAKTLNETNQKSIEMSYSIDKDLNIKGDQAAVLLENGDQVIVRTIPGYEDIRMAKVEGEVYKPGSYNILNKTERISDLVKRSGGLTRFAYPSGAYLIRTEKISGVESKLRQKIYDNAKKQMEAGKTTIDSKTLEQKKATTDPDLKEELTGTKSVKQLLDNEGIVGIDLAHIMENPGSPKDLYLEDGDVLYIPRELQTVKVLGEVLFPTYVAYIKGKPLSYYIKSAGGFSENSKSGKTFVIYANGTAKSTSSFLGIHSYPPVTPGCNIVVPEKPVEIKNKMTTGETISIMSTLVTMATILLSVLK